MKEVVMSANKIKSIPARWDNEQAREFKHDRHDMGKPGKREFNRKDHRDFGGRPNRGAYSPMDRRGPATHRKQETTVMESTNRFSMFGDEDEESCVCL